MQEAMAALEETHAQALDRRPGLCVSAPQERALGNANSASKERSLSKGLFGLRADIAPPTSGRVIVPSEIAIVGAVSPGLRESISCVDPQVLRTPFACDTRRREAEHLVLPRPFGGRVHEASHSHSARQPAFDRSLDEIGGEECE